MKKQIETVLDDEVRPSLAAHGGGIQIMDFNNKKLFVKLNGGCQGCSSANATLKDGVERILVQTFPGLVEEVIDLTNHTNKDNAYM